MDKESTPREKLSLKNVWGVKIKVKLTYQCQITKVINIERRKNEKY